jgi:hypothetical protein
MKPHKKPLRPNMQSSYLQDTPSQEPENNGTTHQNPHQIGRQNPFGQNEKANTPNTTNDSKELNQDDSAVHRGYERGGYSQPQTNSPPQNEQNIPQEHKMQKQNSTVQKVKGNVYTNSTTSQAHSKYN